MSLKLKQYLGQRGEWWVIVQGLLLLGLIILPPVPIISFDSAAQFNIYLYDGAAIILGFTALWFMVKGVLDLGRNLTPLPYPKPGGTLITTGIYRIVRHPLYSGLIFAALGWGLFQKSLSHLLGTVILFIFLDLKARQEENWLRQTYPNYAEYSAQVKKIIPWIY
ncbi:MAG: isoprenylcysteine carboxylmethyltransferase family protein [Microcoleaceae cyanobacterium]